MRGKCESQKRRKSFIYLPQWYSVGAYMFQKTVNTHRCSSHYPLVLNWTGGETQSDSLSKVWIWSHNRSQSCLDTTHGILLCFSLFWSYKIKTRWDSVFHWCILEWHLVCSQLFSQVIVQYLQSINWNQYNVAVYLLYLCISNNILNCTTMSKLQKWKKKSKRNRVTSCVSY